MTAKEGNTFGSVDHDARGEEANVPYTLKDDSPPEEMDNFFKRRRKCLLYIDDMLGMR